MTRSCPTCGDVLLSGSDACYRCTSAPPVESVADVRRACPSCGDALTSAVCYRCSSDYEYMAWPAGPAKPSPFSFAALLVPLAGLAICVVGILLIIGNVTGLFPTFPFAGFITMTVGGLILKASSSS